MSSDASFEISYGATLLGAFGAPAALRSFQAPSSPLPARVAVLENTDTELPIWRQGRAPVCSAVASLTLLQIAELKRGVAPRALSAPYSYFAALEVVRGKENASIRQQLSGGVPLAAAVQAVCEHGVVSGDTSNIYESLLEYDERRFAEQRQTVASLPWPCRAFRLFPDTEQVRLALFGGFAVGIAFQIDPDIDRWMRDPELQHGTRFVIPRRDPFGVAIGAHACVIVGADDDTQLFTVRNSFGREWGERGHFFIPYDLLLLTSFSNNEFFILE